MAKITDEYGNVIGEIVEEKSGGFLETIIGAIAIIAILLVAINCCNPNSSSNSDENTDNSSITTNQTVTQYSNSGTNKPTVSSTNSTNNTSISNSTAKPVDISNLNSVSGSIDASTKKISYKFTPQVDGRYIFYLDNYSGKLKTTFRLYKSNGAEVGYNSQYVYDNGRLYDNLKKGENYTLTIEHKTGESNFSLIINKQKPTKTLSLSSTTSDSFEFSKQINCYSFVAPSTARFVFDTNIPGQRNATLTLYDSANNKIDLDLISHSVGGNLQSGKKYTLKIQTTGHLGNYSVSVVKK